MSLEHTKPPESLLRELDEVASHAAALVEVMTRGLNFPLPDGFPKDQLSDICGSLMALPEGTAEGARSPLDYARHRLPSIRRQYIGSEQSQVSDGAPALVRGAILDQTLTALMSSVSTAFDEYRSLASEEECEFRAEAGIVPNKGSVERAIETAQRLDAALAAASDTVEVVSEPESQKADDLRRQLKDARGFNQLASAEIRMPRVVVGWLRKVIEALKKSPEVIERTVKGIRVGVDVSKVFVDRWHGFADDGVKFVFAQIYKTLDSVEEAGAILGRVANTKSDEKKEDSPANELSQVDRASQRRSELQKEVRAILDQLALCDEGKADKSSVIVSELESNFLAHLQELTRLGTFVRMHRRLSADQDDAQNYVDPSLGRAGHGMSKRVFARLAMMVIRRAGRPLESPEVVEELRKIGHPIGGRHEIKTAYNLLWEAKKAGALIHVKGAGYWVAGSDLPQSALDAAAAARVSRPKKGSDHLVVRGQNSGRLGASRVLNTAETEAARKMLHNKSLEEIAVHFGVSRATIRNYLSDDIKAMRAAGITPPRRKPRKRKSSGARIILKKLGRPPTLSTEQVAEISAMRSVGKSVQDIASEFGVSVSVVYRHLKKIEAGDN